MGTPKQLAAVSSNFACSRYGDRSVAAFPHLACSMTAVLRGPLDQTFPRKRVLTSIPDLLCNLFIYIDKWWDGWPPHSLSKRLFMGRKYFLAHYEGPKKAPRTSGFLGTFADAGGVERHLPLSRDEVCVFRAMKASDSRHDGPWFHAMSVQ